MIAPSSVRNATQNPLGWCSVGALLLMAGWALTTLSWPSPPDGGVFAWLVDVTERGGMPYRDAFETKGPTAWVPVFLVRALTRLPYPVALHLTDTLFLVVGAVGVYLLARRLVSATAGLAAAALAAAWWASLGFESTVQPDAWAGAMLTWSVWLVLRGGTGATSLSGVLLAITAALKPTYLAMLLPLLGTAWLRGRMRTLAALVFGLLVTLLITVGWLWSQDALGAFREIWAWTATAYQYGDAGSLTTQAIGVFGAVTTQPAALAIPLATLGVAELWHRGDRGTALVLCGWAAAILLAIAYQQRFWPYHWHPLMPAMAIMAVLVLHPGTDSLWPRSLTVALLVVLTVLTPARMVFRWVMAQRSAEAWTTFSRREFGDAGAHPGSTLAVADSLLTGVPPTETIFVWGFYPGVAPTLGRPAISRFPSVFPLYVGAPDDPRRLAYQREFLRSVRENPPRFLLIASPHSDEHARSRQNAPIESIPALVALRDSLYRATGDAHGWTVYERR
jgi:hypothetical protein